MHAPFGGGSWGSGPKCGLTVADEGHLAAKGHLACEGHAYHLSFLSVQDLPGPAQ